MILSARFPVRLPHVGCAHEFEQVPADNAVGAEFGGAVLDCEAIPSATADRDNAVFRIDGTGNAVHCIEKILEHWLTRCCHCRIYHY